MTPKEDPWLLNLSQQLDNYIVLPHTATTTLELTPQRVIERGHQMRGGLPHVLSVYRQLRSTSLFGTAAFTNDRFADLETHAAISLNRCAKCPGILPEAYRTRLWQLNDYLAMAASQMLEITQSSGAWEEHTQTRGSIVTMSKRGKDYQLETPDKVPATFLMLAVMDLFTEPYE